MRREEWHQGAKDEGWPTFLGYDRGIPKREPKPSDVTWRHTASRARTIEQEDGEGGREWVDFLGDTIRS